MAGTCVQEVLHDGMDGCREDNIVFISCSKENNNIKKFFCCNCCCSFLVITAMSPEILKKKYPPREGLSFS